METEELPHDMEGRISKSRKTLENRILPGRNRIYPEGSKLAFEFVSKLEKRAAKRFDKFYKRMDEIHTAAANRVDEAVRNERQAMKSLGEAQADAAVQNKVLPCLRSILFKLWCDFAGCALYA